MPDLNAILWAVVAAVAAAALTYFREQIFRSQAWKRDDDRATAGRIERIDSQARESIERIERDLTAADAVLRDRLTRVEENIKHLPTADDIKDLSDKVSRVDAKLENQGELLITIRDTMMQRKGA